MFKTSIRNKLIVLLLLITIIPFGSSIVVTYIYTKESLKDQTIEENVNLLYQGKVNIENYLRELNNYTLSFYSNPDFMSYLRNTYSNNDYLSMGTVHNVLRALLYSDDSITQVNMAIVSDQQMVSLSRRSTLVYSKQVDTNIEAYERAKNNPNNIFIESTDDSILIHRAFRNVPASQILAYITLEIRPGKINEMSHYLFNNSTEEFYIMTPEAEFIYHSTIEELSDQNNNWINEIIESEEQSGTIEWKDSTFQGVVVFDRLSDATGSWLLVKRIPHTTLYESAYGVAAINILFGVIGLILVILATFFVSFKITSPIRVLVQNIKEVEKGNMQVQFQSLGNDEIGLLGQRFKMMIEKINQLINREYKLELENKTNQLKVLHSQINPHFLYNTLQSIGTMALKSKVPEVYSSLTDLSQIMRYSMNMDEDIVPLEKEINYTKSYLLLQKQRFGEDLHYSVEVEEDALNIEVPKMILQPIIENYFKHGFDTRDRLGEIKIICKKKESYLFIVIRDNGVGIPQTRLKEIQDHLYHKVHTAKGGSSIGLKNVYARLKLYYSDLVSFKIQNRSSGGVQVTIKLPLELEGDLHESNHRG
ncbi:cache domain-containing sensor histidine kinase [Halalkalibacter okhensis]|uniref:histidine kinase n=1 Tax=Halalkalibacter okhensis TaxID=333138 RepID=A0A0B0IHF7_9BACI|nr:sensor histidine kinase [Halalkalibacter okhensis]KHF39484.1 histidine kinase [Halalkalibacter okhensis]